MHWNFTKVQILSHAIADIQTDTQMHNYTHLIAPHHSTNVPNKVSAPPLFRASPR